jgi:hypothetical protein
MQGHWLALFAVLLMANIVAGAEPAKSNGAEIPEAAPRESAPSKDSDSSSQKHPDPRQKSQQVFNEMERHVKAGDWRKARAAKKELAALGKDALYIVTRNAKRHDDEQIRMHCYEIITENFGNDSENFETIAHDGLMDESQAVRYHCAWHAGELKIYGAHRRLRRLMEDPKQDDHTRNAAAKSLAQLGESDVIVELVKDMASDHYMPRYMANVGSKALAGKDLNDFNDYDYSEGAFVSGGVELMVMNPHPVDVHEKISKRHAAIAEYCKWLEKNRPEVFKHLYAPW